LIFTNHASFSGEAFTVAGSSLRALFTAVMEPLTGAYTSLAAFTLSTEPNDSLQREMGGGGGR
jgi:hypothetical protein